MMGVLHLKHPMNNHSSLSMFGNAKYHSENRARHLHACLRASPQIVEVSPAVPDTPWHRWCSSPLRITTCLPSNSLGFKKNIYFYLFIFAPRRLSTSHATASSEHRGRVACALRTDSCRRSHRHCTLLLLLLTHSLMPPSPSFLSPPPPLSSSFLVQMRASVVPPDAGLHKILNSCTFVTFFFLNKK